MTVEADFDLLLVDGTALAYQSFHAMPDFKTRAGVPTGAVYGFNRSLDTWRNEYRPRYAAVVFDPHGPTWRAKVLPSYKAHRPEPPVELQQQLGVLDRLVEALGVPMFRVDDWEADDVIARIASCSESWGWRTLIISPDKDLLQLVTERTMVLRRIQNTTKVYSPETVATRYGCTPDQIADYLGLVGDSSDGIPGVTGVGEKTATRLLNEYGSLEAILEHAPQLKSKRERENLVREADLARESKFLATVRRDVPIPVVAEQLQLNKPNEQTLVELFTELEFSKELEKIGVECDNASSYDWQYQIVNTPEALQRLAERLAASPGFAVDTETTSLDTWKAQLVGISVSPQAGEAYYIPVGHTDSQNLEPGTVRQVLGPVLADERVSKYGHHLKYDLHILHNAGFSVQGIAFDTMLASQMLDSSGSHKLDALAERWLGYQAIPITNLIGAKNSPQEGLFSEVPLAEAAQYAAEDAEVTFRLVEKLRPALQEQSLTRVFEDIEMPLVEVLRDMEHRGILLDTALLRQHSREMGKQLESLEKAIHDEADEVFNIASPQQLARVLYDRRGLTAPAKRSTRAEVLENFALQGDQLAQLVTEYRQLAKLKSTYLDTLPTLVYEDGRIRTSYQQLTANTGRISSSNPNLQNIPIRTAEGKRIREGFRAADGCVLVSADYSQIELRVLAHVTKDPGFCEAFEKGWDIHRYTASELFAVPQSEVTEDMRRKAKAINFGLNYGMTEFGLANRLRISRAEAQQYMQRYFQRYPTIQQYIEQSRQQGMELGYATTLEGRRMRITNTERGNASAHAGRTAINAPIQGAAADLLKRAMRMVYDRLGGAGQKTGMVLTIHDEIILETPHDLADEVQSTLRQAMESAGNLSVPLTVDLGVGQRWADLK